MEYKIDWIIPRFRSTNVFWKIASCVTVTTIGVLSKLFMSKLFSVFFRNYIIVCLPIQVNFEISIIYIHFL